MSLVESGANIVVGFGVAIASQLVVFPMVGIPPQNLSTHLEIGAWFTLISLARSYCIRRWFNGLKFRRDT
ncbi:hypothetical protein KHU32_15075 [Roseococcus sp. XZZS9]|uniref:Cation-transporting P-type ATPase C-terminal domain-containing protein n=2 Tax=Roseococcus pinisoli TaxID=2835040 RepID=A0ABS5QH40_9PROT|nr:hypothetical protein [Roseococcus pinisoli]